MFSKEAADMLFNVIDKETLQGNLSFTAFYIAVYENFAFLIRDRIKSFYTTGFEQTEDGTVREIQSPEYKAKIKNRIVDDKGNKDVLKASVLWLVDNHAFSMDDYDQFLKMKEQRNLFAHQLTDVILRGNTEEEIGLFFDMFLLFQKFDKWWINEIEIPAAGEMSPDEYEHDEVESVLAGLYHLMIDALFLDHSESLKEYVKRNTEMQ